MAKRPSDRDVADAIQHAGGEWKSSDFDAKYLGVLSPAQLGQYDDLDSWVELDASDFRGRTVAEQRATLAEFRGEKWADMAMTWKRSGVPPIVVMTWPDEDGGEITQIADGRGRVNAAVALGMKVPAWHYTFRARANPKRKQSKVGRKFDSCVRKVSRKQPDGARAICAATMHRKYPGALQKAAAAARRRRKNPPDGMEELYSTAAGYPVLRWFDPDTGRGYSMAWFQHEHVVEFWASSFRKPGDKGWGFKKHGQEVELKLRNGRVDFSPTQLRELGIAGYQTFLLMGERMRELRSRRKNPSDPAEWTEEFSDVPNWPELRWIAKDRSGGWLLSYDHEPSEVTFAKLVPSGWKAQDGGPFEFDKQPSIVAKLRGGQIRISAAQMKEIGMAGFLTMQEMARRMFKLKSRRQNPSSRFARCVESVRAAGNAYDPEGLCASIGRKKYGKRAFQAMATAGRRRKNPSGSVRFRDCVDAENQSPGLEDPAQTCAARLGARSNPVRRFDSVDAADTRTIRGRVMAPGYTALRTSKRSVTITRAWFERRGKGWVLAAKTGNGVVWNVRPGGRVAHSANERLHGPDAVRMKALAKRLLSL